MTQLDNETALKIADAWVAGNPKTIRKMIKGEPEMKETITGIRDMLSVALIDAPVKLTPEKWIAEPQPREWIIRNWLPAGRLSAL